MNQQRPYSKVDELAGRARSRFAGVTDGSMVLNLIVLLSAILSAIFFWQNSRVMFSGLPPALGWLLSLLVGLAPAEGAYFGWKRVRQSKTDMTGNQVRATQFGLIAAVVFAIFSTLALFVTTFEYVPAEFQRYDVWIVFLALALPCVVQVAIIAYFAVNERAVIENHERAKLGAMGFDAWIHGEQARIQSIIDGMAASLDKQLEGYGARVGKEEAGRVLGQGSQELLNMGNNGHGAGAAEPAPTPPAGNGQPYTQEEIERGASFIRDEITNAPDGPTPYGRPQFTPRSNSERRRLVRRPTNGRNGRGKRIRFGAGRDSNVYIDNANTMRWKDTREEVVNEYRGDDGLRYGYRPTNGQGA